MSIDYNEEPVEYCLNCKSLHIIEEQSKSICANCGSVDFTSIATIDRWLEISKNQN